jgi:hypothetical protein
VPNTKLVWSWLNSEQFRGIWSPDGTLALATGDRGPALVIGNAQAAPVLGVPASAHFYAAIWAPDSEHLLIADRDGDYRFTLVELGKTKPLASYSVGSAKGGDALILPIGFLPDGKRALVWGEALARVVDAASGRTLSSFKAEQPLELSRGSLLAHTVIEQKEGASGRRRFRIYDVETGRTLLDGDRNVTSFVWSANVSRLAMVTEVGTLLWDAKHGLRELSVTGKPVWGDAGRSLAFASGQYSSGSDYRCADCLQPVPWLGVFDFESLAEVSSVGFVPEVPKEMLPSFVIRDLASGSERKLAHTEPGSRVSFGFHDDATLLGVAKPLYFRVDLRTGRVIAWERAEPTEGSVADDESFSLCEDGRLVIHERFSRRVLARLPAELGCTAGSVTILKLPLVAYHARDAVLVVDTSNGKTIARLAGESLASSVPPFALTVQQKDKVPQRRLRPGEYRRPERTGKCEVFDAEKRRRAATPEFPTEPYGSTSCDYDAERHFSGGGQGLSGRFVYREDRGFLGPDGRRSAKFVRFCDGTYSETPHGAVCGAEANDVATFRVWNAATDRVRVVRLDEKAPPFLKPETHERRSIDYATLLLDPSEERLAFVVGGDTHVLELATGVASAWGPPAHRPTRWLDAHTLLVTDRPSYGGRERSGGNVAVKDGAALAGPPPLDAKAPPALGLMPEENVVVAPSGRFTLQGVESPYFLTRLSDGARLELILVEEGGRPYSVLVDAEGHFAGDDAAAAKLSYGVGRGPRDAVLKNGSEMASKFRDDARLRAFVEAR